MNIAVIGLGSMGKRRIRLIRRMYPHHILIGIDGRNDRIKEASKAYGIECFSNISGIKTHIDCAFVCTSPLSHSDIISNCLENGWNVFAELNLISDGYDKNIKLASEKGKKLFLSSTFFYREEIRYIRSKISLYKKWNYIYHIGQYLPDWHPWENYNTCFLGDKRTNGCREIMAIELPWITATFGDVCDFYAAGNNITNLNIDYYDNYIIQLTHKNGSKGCLAVDVVSPVAVRKLEIYGEKCYLSWNGTPDSLVEFDSQNCKTEHVILSEETEHIEGYSDFIVENAYKNEIREFFDVVENNKIPHYGFEQDKKILELIDRIEAFCV